MQVANLLFTSLKETLSILKSLPLNITAELFNSDEKKFIFSILGYPLSLSQIVLVVIKFYSNFLFSKSIFFKIKLLESNDKLSLSKFPTRIGKFLSVYPN